MSLPTAIAQRAAAGHGAVLLVTLGAALWGVYWVPIRAIEHLGLASAWSSTAVTLAAAPAGLIVAAWLRATGLSAMQRLGAVFCGAALTLYGFSLANTDVVRAILLFYLSPIWSLLIETVFFGRRWTIRTTLAVLAAALGMVLIFRGELPLEGLGALGDWMAVGAGLAWSIGSAIIFARGPVAASALTATALVAAGVMSVLLSFALTGTDAQAMHTIVAANTQVVALTATVAAAGIIYLTPVMLVTLWGTSQISPATLGFILTAEIISGVASSALFLGERFGWPEAAGTVLIIIGAVIEVMGKRDDHVPA
ncbi:MAG: DMT family transporter [Pseudomonadota bacterium]